DGEATSIFRLKCDNRNLATFNSACAERVFALVQELKHVADGLGGLLQRGCVRCLGNEQELGAWHTTFETVHAQVNSVLAIELGQEISIRVEAELLLEHRPGILDRRGRTWNHTIFARFAQGSLEQASKQVGNTRAIEIV